MTRDDSFQVWSFCNGQIVRIVASDFTICLYDEHEPLCAGKLNDQTVQRMPGDARAHYARAAASQGSLWKRIT